MILITGALQGDEQAWIHFVDPLLRAGDTLIVAGDFGLGMMFGPMREERFYDWIEARPYRVLFVDGDDESFDRLNALPAADWCGGRVHLLRRNLIHLMRGEVYAPEGKRLFTFGGGYSPDKTRPRRPQALPSEAEYRNAETHLRALREQNLPVDYIITHTAPAESVYALSRIPEYGVRDDIAEDRQLTVFLNAVACRTGYRKWYFGHYPADAELWGDQIALLHAVRELESGSIVGWKSPKHD